MPVRRQPGAHQGEELPGHEMRWNDDIVEGIADDHIVPLCRRPLQRNPGIGNDGPEIAGFAEPHFALCRSDDFGVDLGDRDLGIGMSRCPGARQSVGAAADKERAEGTVSLNVNSASARPGVRHRETREPAGCHAG